jgi:putative ABC transport system ATP-binding protein
MNPSVISFCDVSFSYGEGKLRRQVLFDASGEIRAGEIVIIKGPSGSGKTTLLTLLGALRAAQQGEISVLGQRLDGASPKELLLIRRRIGFVFQMHNLIAALTATQNLLMALRLHPLIDDKLNAARSILGAVGLSHAVNLHPHHLSGGERQRVAIARALVTRPKIVLADEPTASLDGHTGHMVIEMLRKLANENGSAVLLVTHDARVLDVGDRVVTMEDGRLAGAGSDKNGSK